MTKVTRGIAAAAMAMLGAWTIPSRAQDSPLPGPEPKPPKEAAPSEPKPATPAPRDERPAAPPEPAPSVPTEPPPPGSPATPPPVPPSQPVAPAAPVPPSQPVAPAAPTAPPVAGYAPVHAPPPTPSVHVHIDADRADIVLERHDGRNDVAKRGWYVVCSAPCDQAVAAPPSADFRFNGAGTRSSHKFQLSNLRYAAFDVEGGSQGQWTGGWVAVGVGGATLITGAAVIASTYPGFYVLGGYDEDEFRKRRTIGGVLVGVGIAIGVGLGLPLLLTSKTQYEIVDQRAWLDLKPDGFAIRF